jgi:hypothetical protein
VHGGVAVSQKHYIRHKRERRRGGEREGERQGEGGRERRGEVGREREREGGGEGGRERERSPKVYAGHWNNDERGRRM